MLIGMVGIRSHRRWVGLAAAAAVLCLTVVSMGAESAAAAPGGPRKQTGIDWKNCPGLSNQFQCAKVPVPLDWGRPNDKQIELAAIRHVASNPLQRIGSMFINPGGPGLSGFDFVRDNGAELDGWGGGQFDVVSWDPRGTNRSSPVECFKNKADEDRFWAGAQIPITDAQSVAYQQKTVELARRCGDVSGELLSHITTADTARDLEALRRLVGDRQLTFVGLSYGSRIGQTYANLFPDLVRAMVLDGIDDAVATTSTAEARTINNVSGADAVFDQFIELCQRAAPGRCALAGHGETVAQRVTDLFTRAHNAPIPAPNADPPGVLTYGDLLVSIFNPVRVPLTWPKFAEKLDAAAGGDASKLEMDARAMQTPQALAGATTSAAISCGDGPASLPSSQWPAAIATFTNDGQLYGPVLGWWLWAPCASGWPANAPDRYTGPWNAKTATPILLLSALFDPATPYRNAQTALQRLGNAVLLTFNSYGHPSFQVPSQCMDQARKSYLVELQTPSRGAVCQPDQAPFG